MAWYLFLLVVAGVIAVFAWDYRKKAAQREAARKERFEQVFGSRGPVTVAAAAPDPSAQAGKSVAGAPPKAVPSAVERFLGAPETVVYLLLKTGIPDHEVFARVTLAALVSAPGANADREQYRRRLSQHHIDFVVCDRDMRVVAAVDLDRVGDVDAQGERRFKTDCLKHAGIPLIRIQPGSLPRREAIRALILGGTGATDRALLK